MKRGHKVVFDSDGCRIFTGRGELLATGSLVNDMFKLHTKSEFACNVNSKVDEPLLWHKRFAHANMNALNSALQTNMKIDATCIICAKGKLARKPFNESGTRATQLLELIHSDVCGPMSVKSLGGAKYFVTFIDDYSRKVFAYAMKTKGEVFSKFIEFKKLVEN